MIYAVICAAIVIFGVCYAARPAWFLKRKYPYEEEIPAVAIRTARVVGVAIAVFGGVALVYNLAV